MRAILLPQLLHKCSMCECEYMRVLCEVDRVGVSVLQRLLSGGTSGNAVTPTEKWYVSALRKYHAHTLCHQQRFQFFHHGHFQFVLLRQQQDNKITRGPQT